MTVRLDATPIGDAPTFDLARLVAARSQPTIPANLCDAFVATESAAAANLDILRREPALCVTTGQQPGLFTGPLFTIYKALSAVALADRFSKQLERPVVPVFWVAGDDHDLAESNHMYATDMANAVQRIALYERDEREALTPLYKEKLGAQVSDARQTIVELTPDTEYRASILEILDAHYHEDADYASAFAGALDSLLGRLGLVIFRPTSLAAKQAMVPILRRTLEHAHEIDAALAAKGRELAGAGLPVPVHVGDGAAPMMIEGSMGRDRLVPDGRDFVARRSGEHWSMETLSELLDNEPQRFSPNVLLRPVVEATLLPTLAYVAGPGELAYFPQCAPLYEFFGITPQQPVARWSGRILETKIAKVMDKLGIEPADLAASEGQLEGKLASADMPEGASSGLAGVRKALQEHYAAIEDAAASIDPTMRKAVQAARNTSLAATTDLEKRLVSHLKSHNDTLTKQIAKARNNLFPLGKPQERIFNIVPYLIRYGPTLVDQLLDACRRWYENGDAHDG